MTLTPLMLSRIETSTKPLRRYREHLLSLQILSYLTGNDNDITEKTTILLFLVSTSLIIDLVLLSKTIVEQQKQYLHLVRGSCIGWMNCLQIPVDITQENNIFRFNSVNGGVVVPRGTSIVGLDLRKTKLRPKYVPNPTDDGVSNSPVFKLQVLVISGSSLSLMVMSLV